MKEMYEQIKITPGYSADYNLPESDLEYIKDAITEQWLARISEVHPDLTEKFAKYGIDKYHEICGEVDHNELWKKRFRLLPEKTVKKIKQLSFFKDLATELGTNQISDVVHEDGKVQEGHGEVYWRLVRPESETDVGPLHADKWFHNVIGGEYGMFKKGLETIKLWCPVFCEPGKNGLIIVPDSHKKEWKVKYTHNGTAQKPNFDDVLGEYEERLMDTYPGNALLFNEATLHRGAINKGNRTRVSFEITFVKQVQ